MSTKILFVQGAGESAHEIDGHLVRNLTQELGAQYSILYPQMPNEADPRYADWKATLLDAFHDLDDNAIVIGHSAGGAVLVQILAEEQPNFRPAVIILIASPFIGDGGWSSEDIEPCADLAGRLPAETPVLLYYGAADKVVPPAHAQLYAKAIPRAVLKSLPNRDHQLNNDLSEVAQDIHSLSYRT